MGINILYGPAVCTIMTVRQMGHIPLKCWYLSTKLYSIASLKYWQLCIRYYSSEDCLTYHTVRT